MLFVASCQTCSISLLLSFMRYNKTRAVVLSKSHHDTGKYLDLVVFTEDWGKQRMKVRGVKSPKSKLASMLEPYLLLTIDTYSVAEGVYILTGASVQESYPAIVSSLDAMATLWKMIEVLDVFLPIAEEHPEIVQIYASALQHLAKDTVSTYAWFLLQILHYQGYISVEKICAGCSSSLQNKTVLKALDEWVFYCNDCALDVLHKKEIPFSLLKLCMFGQRCNLETFVRVSLEPHEWVALVHFLEETCEYVAGIKLQSFSIA